MIDGRRTQTVQLGCGTLILIALIVLFFSRGGGGVGDLEGEVHGLRREIGELKKAIEVQSLQIQLLQEKVDRAKDKE